MTPEMDRSTPLLTADVPARLADDGPFTRRHPSPAAIARALVQNSLDGIMVFASVRGEDGNICDFRWLQANEAAGEVIGRRPDELIGALLREQTPGDPDDTGLFERYVAVVESGRPYRTTSEYQRDGTEGVVAISAVRVDDGVAVTFRDITAQQRSEREHARATFHDPLTGLPNRTLLNERLGRVARLSAIRDVAVAVLVIDLDRFSLVNNTFGSDRGDELLIRTARRLEAIVDEGDTVARTGGDEFTLLCHDLRDDLTLTELCEAVSIACVDAIGDDEASFRATASIGVALARGQAVTGDMVRNAHAAMHRAKANGRGRYEFADDSLRQEIADGAEIVRGLLHALDNDEFEVHFQPIFSPDLALRSTEALVRWRRNDELVPPNVFLPVAEEHGLIRTLGRHVLATSLAQLAAWDEELGACVVPTVSVNLAAEQLDELLPAMVMNLLDTYGLSPDRLCLEVTESSLITRPELAERSLRELAESGVTIALDDFGTGYSPLTYLKQLPVGIVKIDRSFIARITEDDTDVAVVEAVVNLSHKLSKLVVAEGVETASQLAVIRDLGIDAVQGFLLGRPVPASEFADVLHAGIDRS